MSHSLQYVHITTDDSQLSMIPIGQGEIDHNPAVQLLQTAPVARARRQRRELTQSSVASVHLKWRELAHGTAECGDK